MHLSINKKQTRWLIPYLLIAPAIILMFWIVIYPIINAIKMSFFEYFLYKRQDSTFVGLQNYINLFKENNFPSIAANTVYWVAFCLIFQILIGFVCALVLNREFWGRGLLRSFTLIPWITPTVVITLMWRWMYDTNYGVINDILFRIGIIDKFQSWLSMPSVVLTCVSIVKVWQGVPFFAIMILAALQTIPVELYESADIDGASSWDRFWAITMPYVMPITLITILLRTVWIANDVDIIYMMTGGGPITHSLTLSVYAYQTAQAMNFGKSSAIAIIYTIVLMMLVVFYLYHIQKSEEKFR